MCWHDWEIKDSSKDEAPDYVIDWLTFISSAVICLIAILLSSHYGASNAALVFVSFVAIIFGWLSSLFLIVTLVEVVGPWRSFHDRICLKCNLVQLDASKEKARLKQLNAKAVVKANARAKLLRSANQIFEDRRDMWQKAERITDDN